VGFIKSSNKHGVCRGAPDNSSLEVKFPTIFVHSIFILLSQESDGCAIFCVLDESAPAKDESAPAKELFIFIDKIKLGLNQGSVTF